MSLLPLTLGLVLALVFPLLNASATDQRGAPGIVIVDDSEFYHEIPKGNILSDLRRSDSGWIFNGSLLTLVSAEEASARVRIAETGRYHLFVRSRGTDTSSFRVSVNGQTGAESFGSGPLSWKRGGSFDLPAGEAEIRLTQISPMAAMDVLVLSRKEDLQEQEIQPLQFPPDVQLLKEYAIPSALAVKFGDVTGDGKSDFMVLTREYSAHVIDHDGRELWKYEAPREGSMERGSFEAPGSIWDFDGDGRAEVVHWRLMEGEEWLVLADGMTGEIRKRVKWPTPPLPHVYNNFRTAIAKFGPGRAEHLVVLTDSGGTISVTAYNAQLEQVWQHRESRLKDHFGHYIYPVDLDGDGIDEVAVSSLLLDASGKVLWQRNDDLFPDHRDHVDSYRFTDLDGNGKPELLAATSDVGVVIFRAKDGEVMWKQPANHSQQIQFGAFLDGVSAPQVVVGARTYGDRQRREPYLWGQLYWFDATGKLLSKWPRNPLTGNPDFVKGDWIGDGTETLFWYKFRIGGDGRGQLYFGEPVYHMFDFMGNGAEQVITLRGGLLKVYGSASAKAQEVSRGDEYRRNSVANHSHY